MFANSIPLPTDEEFNLFHSIDRELYSKLIIDLGRGIVDSMNVMAFWMWLEQQSTGGMTLVKKMLSLPSHVIDNLVDESIVCLKCAEKDHFSYPESAYELNFLSDMLGKNVPLKFFYDHRLMVLQGVTIVRSQVCARVFQDINQNALDAVTKRVEDFSFGSVRPVLYSTSEELGFDRSLEDQRMQQSKMGEIFSKLKFEKEENEGNPEDRTIFLTFSKGYPVSEAEVREFFTRIFGDFIEEIHMQVVPPGEQVLYARVVARRASVMDAVVGDGKTKYNINGKHVCARKFVKRNPSSSSFSSSAAASAAQSRTKMASV